MNFLTKFWREMPHGGRVRSGWPMVWDDPRRQVGMCTATPLHWLAYMFREFRYRMKLAVTAPSIEHAHARDLQRAHEDRERLAEEYSKGYVAGWHECFEACLQAVEEEITSADKVWKMGAAFLGSETTLGEN